MDWLSFIVAGVMVYVAVAVFLGGSIYRIVKWLRTPKSPVTPGHVSRGPGNGLSAQPQTGQGQSSSSRRCWTPTAGCGCSCIGMHLAGIGLFIGTSAADIRVHVRIYNAARRSTAWKRWPGWVGGAIGIALFVAFTYFLMRRFKSPYRELVRAGRLPVAGADPDVDDCWGTTCGFTQPPSNFRPTATIFQVCWQFKSGLSLSSSRNSPGQMGAGRACVHSQPAPDLLPVLQAGALHRRLCFGNLLRSE